ncbi:MAG: Rrf2 family transcriptional regulator [Anaerohalosphaera sp.]|nr:Rrf2 family transcriptional regulator [Anaerohalosphaera sp.]
MAMSSRIKYGVPAIFELAKEYGNKPVHSKLIAQRTNVPAKYLEQIVTIFLNAGLLESIRGAKGGFLLAKPPSQIRLIDVFTALEGKLIAEPCPEHREHSPNCPDCVYRQFIQQINDAVSSKLAKTTLQDLVDKAAKQ